jgi:hypothetical protein
MLPVSPRPVRRRIRTGVAAGVVPVVGLVAAAGVSSFGDSTGPPAGL